MKNLQLEIDNSIYDMLLAMLKGLPKDKIKIEENNSVMTPGVIEKQNIMKYAGTVNWKNDGVEYQRTIRDKEW